MSTLEEKIQAREKKVDLFRKAIEYDLCPICGEDLVKAENVIIGTHDKVIRFNEVNPGGFWGLLGDRRSVPVYENQPLMGKSLSCPKDKDHHVMYFDKEGASINFTHLEQRNLVLSEDLVMSYHKDDHEYRQEYTLSEYVEPQYDDYGDFNDV